MGLSGYSLCRPSRKRKNHQQQVLLQIYLLNDLGLQLLPRSSSSPDLGRPQLIMCFQTSKDGIGVYYNVSIT